MFENTSLRHRYFYRQFLNLQARSPNNKISELAWQAACSPAPAYFITFQYAHRMVSRLIRSGDTAIHRAARAASPRQRMIAEIAQKCLERMQHYPRLNLSRALARVLAFEHSSCYFYTRQYAISLCYRLIRTSPHRLKSSSPHRATRRRQRKLL